jgi:peptide/nickel transport system substrate-binding protein
MSKLRILCLVLGIIVLAACAPAVAPSPTAPAAPASTAPVAPAPTAVAPTAVAPSAVATSAGIPAFKEVPRNRTVIFENIEGRVPIPNNMNPYIHGQYLDWGMWQATQESLFYLNYETGKLIPWQATGYSYNSDFTKLTINIRPGVKWSDGVPFTANDVVFTINMLKKYPELNYSADMKQWVADITAPDDQTVVFTLTTPNPRFLVRYLGVQIWESILILPQHIWEGKDPLTFTNFDLAKGWPIGTGPYRVSRSTETETDYDRRDDWWGAVTGFHSAPAPERAIWIGIASEEVRAAKAVANELDASWLFSRSTFETAHNKNPNVVGWTKDLPYAYLDPCPRFLGLNNAVPPFNDRDVRWAVSHAIKRDDLVTIAYEGMTEPSNFLLPTYPSLKAFLDRNKGLFQTYPVSTYDSAEIDKVMTAKGYKRDANGLWAGADGKHVTFTLITRSGEADKVKMGPVLVDQMRKAGFDADFQPLESAVYYDEVSKGTVQAWIADLCGSVQDPYTTFSLFHSRWAAPVGQPSTGTVSSRFKNPDFDPLVDQMAKTDPADPAFGPIADKALEIWLRELPAIPLVQARLLTPFITTYWTNWPSAENNYVQPCHWCVTGSQILLNIKPVQ